MVISQLARCWSSHNLGPFLRIFVVHSHVRSSVRFLKTSCPCRLSHCAIFAQGDGSLCKRQQTPQASESEIHSCHHHPPNRPRQRGDPRFTRAARPQPKDLSGTQSRFCLTKKQRAIQKVLDIPGPQPHPSAKPRAPSPSASSPSRHLLLNQYISHPQELTHHGNGRAKQENDRR